MELKFTCFLSRKLMGESALGHGNARPVSKAYSFVLVQSAAAIGILNSGEEEAGGERVWPRVKLCKINGPENAD